MHTVEGRPTTLTWLDGGGNLSAAADGDRREFLGFTRFQDDKLAFEFASS